MRVCACVCVGGVGVSPVDFSHWLQCRQALITHHHCNAFNQSEEGGETSNFLGYFSLRN